jgi:hypothetical protein
MMQQQMGIKPLTKSQERVIKVLKQPPTVLEGNMFRSIANIALGIAWVSLGGFVFFSSFSGFNPAGILFIITGLAPLFIGLVSLSNLKDTQKDIKLLSACDNPLAVGALTKAILICLKKDRSTCIKTLIPLLYTINNQQAEEVFTQEHAGMLRAIVTKPYWRKHEPDLVAAAIVALVAVHDSKSKNVLERLSWHSWRHAEAWVGEAAKMCLTEWDKRETATNVALKVRFHSQNP